MPSPNGPTGNIDFTDAPGGEINLDDLFPNPEVTTQPETQPRAAQPQAPAQPAPSDFLKSEDGKIVYKTSEDAIRGISEKDRLIEQLRQEYVQNLGVDPITKKQVGQPRQPQAPEAPNFLKNPERFYDLQAEAVAKGDKKAFAEAQAQFLNDYLSPIAPVFTQMARSQAVERVAQEIPEVKTFLGSDDYKSTLSARPALAAAIQNAESNFQYYESLPELYRLAFEANQVRKLPDIIKAQVDAARQAAVPPPTPRQTQAPQTLTPPGPGDSVQPGYRTTAERQALIRQAEANGVLDFKF